MVQARSGGEALQILASHEDIDGRVTDNLMPQIQARTLIARARELRPALPALLVTGFAESLDAPKTDPFARLASRSRRARWPPSSLVCFRSEASPQRGPVPSPPPGRGTVRSGVAVNPVRATRAPPCPVRPLPV